MDLSLQPKILAIFFYLLYFLYSFNPCFNGSFTSTNTLEKPVYNPWNVSILVLMDLSLQLRVVLRVEYNSVRCVSILVLMDLSLQQFYHYTN